MADLEKIIVQLEVKQKKNNNVEKLEEEWNLYNETGFEEKAKELKPRFLFAKAIQKMGNPIVVKRPSSFREFYSPLAKRVCLSLA